MRPEPCSRSKTPAATSQSVLKQLELHPRVQGEDREGNLSESASTDTVEMRNRAKDRDGSRAAHGIRKFVVINNQCLVNKENESERGNQGFLPLPNPKWKPASSHTSRVNRAEPK